MATRNRLFYLLNKLRRDIGDIADNPTSEAWLTDDSGLVYSNVQLLDALDSSIWEATRRNPILAGDSGTDNINLDIAIGVTEYQLNPAILAISSARLVTADRVLGATTKDVVDWTLDYPYAQVRYGSVVTAGYNYWIDPLQTYYLREDGILTLVGEPTEADTLALTVQRTPLEHLSWPTGTTATAIKQGLFIQAPPTDEVDDLHLLHYAEYELYSVNERDAEAVQKAETCLAKFTAAFGSPMTVKARKRWGRRQNRRPRARSYFE